MSLRPILALAAAAACASCPMLATPTAEAAGPCSNVLIGTAVNDQIAGTVRSDRILGFGGNDELAGAEAGDCLFGARGADRLYGEAGNDRLVGGSSADELRGGSGNDRLEGQSGDDELFGGSGRDVLYGGSGDDNIREVGEGYGPDEVFDVGHSVVDAGPGDDTIDVANGRRDRVSCGADTDSARADRFDRLKDCERTSFLVSPFPHVNPASTRNLRRSFVVEFRSLATTDRRTQFFSISVQGPARCGSITSNSVGATYHRNRVVPYQLLPFDGSGRRAQRWCRGRYRGSVAFVEMLNAGCKVSVSDPPPPSCTRSRRIGVFSFRVR